LEVPSSFFNLLNDDVVDDIDQDTLKDYENDMDESNGEKGDEEEVEEIDERVFDDSQPAQCKRIMNYTDVEGACLVQAWESVSLDAMAGNDQTKKRYWQRIEDQFFQCIARLASPTPARIYRSLQHRWDVIK
jgi:hypothetical protein